MVRRLNFGKKQKEKHKFSGWYISIVTEIHHEIKALEKGRKTIIIGDHGHDEVVAIAAQVEKPIIIANIDEAKNMRK